MDDDDLNALAAEYVLGTLASDERAHAEALIAVDPGFVESVRQWERRLGELNVMVEAVEPPAEIWDKIKSGIGTVAQSDDVRLVPLEPTAPPPPPTTVAAVKAGTETKPQAKAEVGETSLLAALASSLSAPEGEAEVDAQSGSQTQAPAEVTPKARSLPTPPTIERSADVFYLANRVRRWRRLAVGAGALAAVLAAIIVLSQAAPGLIPAGGFHIPQLIAQSPAPAAPTAPPSSRLVAVLQQEPSSPAFLLTIDPTSRTLTVRRVTATAQAGHSFELWLIAPHAAKPRSLGLVGVQEYTQHPLPAEFDVDALRTATYAVSFEPAGGSKTGAPTGPILFTGKPVETVPPPQPPKA